MQSRGLKPTHEEPQLEETNVSEEVHNAVRWAIMRVHKNLVHASKELLCRALRFGGANKMLRAASELTCDVCSEKSLTCLRSWLIRILNSIKALEWISLIGLRRTSVRVPEHCRFATRFKVSLSVPSKRPDDVLSCACDGLGELCRSHESLDL